MILQSLYQLYDRLAEDPDNGLPKPGYSLQNISFCVVIKPDGSLVEIQPKNQQTVTITKSGAEKISIRPLSLIVPGQSKPSGQGINPCLLWDNPAYMLGYKADDPKKSEADQEKDRVRTATSFEAFCEKHLKLKAEIDDPDFSAVCRFLQQWDTSTAAEHPVLTDLTSGFGIFQISAKTTYVHQSAAVRNWWNQQNKSEAKASDKFCLVSGETAPTAITHDPAIKGVAGAQSMGAKLVSFNEKAYESFGKEAARKAGQGLNAPVSEIAAFAYCNALNWLLARKERRFRIGDATAIFWTDSKSPAENLMPWMMSGVPDAEDQKTKDRVLEILGKISSGTLGRDELGDADTTYHVLGLSPNASRLSVRFWHSGTLGDLISKLKLHLDQLKLVRQFDETNSKYPDPLTPNAYQLLRQTAREADGIPPQLGGALMRSILLGEKYPETLATAVINRIRAEREISYLKAAILKAWLIRNHNRPITIMLDETNTNPGYRLGRLFAVLEKTQQDALPGLNATIRDRFYASASATPRAVFGRLLRMYPNHLSKAQSEWSGKFGLDKAIKMKNGREIQTQEILSPLTDFPAHLNLQNQSQFALGYYHQRKDFFTKKATTEPQAELPANA